MSNITVTKFDGTPCNPEAIGLNARLAEVFRRPDDKMASFIAELKLLTDKDRADFAAWFTTAGLPIKA